MLSQIKMKLVSDTDLTYQMSSLFHGFLMESISKEYADRLHGSSLHPFSQHLDFSPGGPFWVVNCLNEEARDKIIFNCLMRINDIELKKISQTLHIEERVYKEVSSKELTDRFYGEDSSRYTTLHFITPTAFKQNGRYLFFPDLRCIYQSLMNKYDASDSTESMFDEDTLEELYKGSEISRYDIKSTLFHLEGVRIPSYIGKITIKVNGTQTMANFARMLFEFGKYSGIGIKTSIGMGAYRIIESREKKK